MLVILLTVTILVLMVLRVPIGFALLGPCLLYMLYSGYTPDLAFRLALRGVESWPLLAVPLFVLVGVAANRSGMAERLFDLAMACVGRVRGGLGYVNVGVSLGFSWMSGASLADVAGLGAVEVPAMRKRGYSPEFASGVTVASSLIGPIMPPSIPAIIYATVAAVSTGAMFAAGVFPALLITASLALTVYMFARTRPELRGDNFNRGALAHAAKRAVAPALAPVIIIGGILGGFFTPTEAAAVGALYVLFIGFASRSLSLFDLREAVKDTVTTTAAIMLILGGSAIFGWILARERVPNELAELISQVTTNETVFLFIAALFLLALGCFMESLAALVITVPVLLPVATSLGVDPVHFGSVVILSLMIGLMTPPFGAAVYVLAAVTDVPAGRIFRGSALFLPAMVFSLVVIILLPDVALWLPRSLGL